MALLLPTRIEAVSARYMPGQTVLVHCFQQPHILVDTPNISIVNAVFLTILRRQALILIAIRAVPCATKHVPGEIWESDSKLLIIAYVDL
ncbi:hypothetical protein CHS0354_039301, partial [Potamilus streckersoni]